MTLLEVPVGRGGSDGRRASGDSLSYRDGPRDAETLLVHPTTGRVYVVSKSLLGGVALRRARDA